MKYRFNLKSILFTLVVSLYSFTLFAQQDPQFTQYMYDQSIFNPAYVSSKDNMSIYGMYRTQWVGMEGAPNTATISLTTPIGDKGLGMGVHVMNDRIGAMNENKVAFDLAYNIDVNYNYRLALGIKGSLDFLDVDYTKLNIYNTATIPENYQANFVPNIGAGAMLFSDKTYIGISVPAFIANNRYDNNEVSLMKQRMTFYLTGGHVFDINDNLLFKPAMMIKATAGAPLEVDLTANFLFMEKFTIGAAYRWDAAVSGLVGFQISDSVLVGYSYDTDVTRLNKYNKGSHELFLKFDILNRTRRVYSPRFF